MNIRRTLSVSKRVFRGLRNDRRSIILMFVAPILAMFVFGLAFSGSVVDVPVIVVNQDEGFQNPLTGARMSVSELILSNIDKEALDLVYLDSPTDGVERVQRGEARAVIIFPEYFSRDLFLKIQKISTTGNSTIQVRMDKSNVNVASVVIQTISNAMMNTVKTMGNEPPISIDVENPIYGQNAKFMDFFVPGIMTFVVFLITTLLTLISFVGERTSGNLERLLATPLRETEIVVGYAITFGVIGMLQTALLLTIGITVFHILIVGNILIAFLIIVLLAVVSLSLGILLSSLARREAQAIQFLPLIVLPTFLLAGIFWPVEAIPSWLRPVSWAVPPTYAVDGCRSVMLRGWGITEVWKDIAALAGFALVFLSAAVGSLKLRRG